MRRANEHVVVRIAVSRHLQVVNLAVDEVQRSLVAHNYATALFRLVLHDDGKNSTSDI